MKKIAIILMPLLTSCMPIFPQLEVRPIVYVSSVRVSAESLEGQCCSRMSEKIDQCDPAERDALLVEAQEKGQLFWKHFKAACAKVVQECDASAIEAFDEGCGWTIYINPKYDVTKQVIDILNREYSLAVKAE